MVKRKIGIIVIVLCCMWLLPFYAMAASTTDAVEPIDPQKECALTIGYAYDGNAFSDVSVKIYKVADVSHDFEYTLTESFESSGLVLDGVQSNNEWNIIRTTLESHILANKRQADATAVTDSLGQAHFEKLAVGMYLVVSENVVKDDVQYIFDSALVALPNVGVDGAWQYEVAVNVKSELIPPIDSDEKREFKVVKLWKGDDKSNRPQSIEVEIFKNGTSYDTVILSQENNWSYSWSVKDDGSKWNMAEKNIPSGYVMTVENRDKSFVVTNTFVNPDSGDSPETGNVFNVMLCIIAINIVGILLVILGIVGKRKRV